ncbi:MAG: MBL fold metallo-hydrolase [Candidatus Thorarchaeota archaeon]
MFEHISGPIHFLTSRSFDSNITFLDCGDEQVLIDTGTGVNAEHLEKSLESLGSSMESITDVILTHSHIDHIGGIAILLEEASPKLHLHKAEADMINKGDMSLTLSDTFSARLPPLKIECILEEGEVVRFGDLSLRVYSTPGHSIGSVCLEILDTGIIVTGDTMFPGGSFGRVDFPTGNPRQLVESLRRLSEISFEIALPGHMNAIKHGAQRSAIASYEMARNWFKV